MPDLEYTNYSWAVQPLHSYHRHLAAMSWYFQFCATLSDHSYKIRIEYTDICVFHLTKCKKLEAVRVHIQNTGKSESALNITDCCPPFHRHMTIEKVASFFSCVSILTNAPLLLIMLNFNWHCNFHRSKFSLVNNPCFNLQLYNPDLISLTHKWHVRVQIRIMRCMKAAA